MRLEIRIYCAPYLHKKKNYQGILSLSLSLSFCLSVLDKLFPTGKASTICRTIETHDLPHFSLAAFLSPLSLYVPLHNRLAFIKI